MALVRVEGGSLSVPQLVQELSRLIPERWNWQVNQVERNYFVVPFPTKADLQRSVAFGRADIKEHGVSLLFEEWKEEDEGDELDTIWVRVFRLPTKLQEYPVFWAIGSMLGATQAVDMIATIDYSYGRVQVVVLSVERVPRKLDVVIGKRFYVVHLQVEGRDPDPAIDNMEVDDRDNDGHDKKGDEGNNNDTDDKGKKINDARSEQHKKKNSLTTTKEQQENGSKVNEALSVEEADEFGEEFNMMRTSKYPIYFKL
ncbi:hypothetical protein EJB05_33598, partial [Eragrostis curvula]